VVGNNGAANPPDNGVHTLLASTSNGVDAIFVFDQDSGAHHVNTRAPLAQAARACKVTGCPMGIASYLKDIGRGKEGARALSRAQATDLVAQILDGQVSDLEIGGFCLAMRIKGETAEEMAGFLDAAQARLQLLPNAGQPTVVLPSYNGARKLPVLTPLLGLLLARQGVAVVIHGSPGEPQRISTEQVLAELATQPGLASSLSLAAQPQAPAALRPGVVHYRTLASLNGALARLLDVRQWVGLRNPAHSLVKLMNPCTSPALLVCNYTHPEYAVSMAATLTLLNAHAMLLRGTEGEPVADARRMPQMDILRAGQVRQAQAVQIGTLATLPELPARCDAASTVHFIQQVLVGAVPIPAPIARQVQIILEELNA